MPLRDTRSEQLRGHVGRVTGPYVGPGGERLRRDLVHVVETHITEAAFLVTASIARIRICTRL
eukprot:1389339-Rhodomonas_salina.1